MKQIWIVAQKEFSDGLRNRWLLSITLVFALLAVLITGFGAAVSGSQELASLDTTIASLASLAVFLIPLIALLLSFDSFVGEKEQGTLLLLLTYPLSKLQLLIGKFLGQGAIIAVAILLGFGSAGLWLFWQLDDNTVLLTFLQFIFSATLLGLCFIAISYLVSVNVSEKSKAAGIALIVWFLFASVFDLIVLGLLVSTNTQFSEAGLTQLLMFNPTDIFRLLNIANFSPEQTTGVLATAIKHSFSITSLYSLLVLWIIIPLILALYSFSRKPL